MTEGVFIRTYGCQMNEYDSRKLLKILENNFHPVERAEQADLILVNTCSVREKPEQKLYSLLGELSALKRENPRLLVGVGGCVAQREGEAILGRSKTVDFVFGTHNLSLVPSLIQARRAGLPRQAAVDYRDEWEELPIGTAAQGNPTALVAVSRGCNKNCSFCIVPKTRGPEVSRAFDEILKEVRLASHGGAREVLLLGQTVNSYGRDLDPKVNFSELLDAVSQIEEIKRIRFLSPHPQEVRADFIEAMVSNPKICRHIHLPLQSGSDRILKAMNRNYRRDRFLKIVDELRYRAPDMAITTDIIVGFPGETDEDFEATLEMMERIKFDGSFSFVYSSRPGTPAEQLPDPVPYETKLSWLQKLQAAQESISSRSLCSWVGKLVEVLVDGVSSGNSEELQGRTSQNFVVNFPKPESCMVKPGDLVSLQVVAASRHTLRGEVAGS